MSLLAAYIATLGGPGGGSGGGVALPSAAVIDTNGGSASSSYRVASTGQVFGITSAFGVNSLGNWISPTSSAPGLYEIKAEVLLGSVTGSATGSWLAMTSTRTWTIALTGPGYGDAQLEISIRLGAGPVLTTASVNLLVEAL